MSHGKPDIPIELTTSTLRQKSKGRPLLAADRRSAILNLSMRRDKNGKPLTKRVIAAATGVSITTVYKVLSEPEIKRIKDEAQGVVLSRIAEAGTVMMDEAIKRRDPDTIRKIYETANIFPQKPTQIEGRVIHAHVVAQFDAELSAILNAGADRTLDAGTASEVQRSDSETR